MMSTSLSPSARDVKIKTGVVKRLSKELDMYKLEAREQETKIEEMISAGKDEYDIKKQREVLQESLRMIPEVHKRLDTSYQELRTLMGSYKSETEEGKAAIDILDQAQSQLYSK